jgi:hypothetical protein
VSDHSVSQISQSHYQAGSLGSRGHFVPYALTGSSSLSVKGHSFSLTALLILSLEL